MKKSGYTKNEQGIVSLIVVTILTITLSLIAIGFSKLADRELRQAADRELAAQAYYSAQTGLNDALAYLSAGGTTFTGCTNWPSSPVNGNLYFTTDFSSNGAARYSCLSINDNPQILSYLIQPGEPKVVKIVSDVSNLYFGWQNASYPKSGPTWLGGTGNLPMDTAVAPSATGLLRTTIYRIPGSDTSDTNANLSSGARLYYMYPNAGNGTPGAVDYGSGSYSISSGPGGTNGNFIPGNCKNNPVPNPVPKNVQAIPSYCNTVITGLKGTPINTYYLYLAAQYAPLLVRIQATDGSGNPQTFSGAQGVVDVTGTGADQVQRIRARVDLTDQYNEPTYSIQSMETLCKDFNIQLIGPSQYGPALVQDPQDPACTAPTGFGDVGGTAGDTQRH